MTLSQMQIDEQARANRRAAKQGLPLPYPAPRQSTEQPDGTIEWVDNAEAKKTNHQKFVDFHSLNPWVLDRLEEMAAGFFEGGNYKCSVYMLVEALRWERGTTVSVDGFKISNDLKPHYARALIERRPEWKGRFDLKQLKVK